MKVLLVAINYDPEPTGIAPYASGLARGLRAAGHDVHVITGIPHYPTWRRGQGPRSRRTDEVLDGVPVTRLDHYIPPGGIGWRRALMEISFGLHLVTVPWGRPDVVVTVSPPLLSSAAALVRARFQRRVPRRRRSGQSTQPNTATQPKTVLWGQDLYSRGLAELGDPTSRTGRLTARLGRGLEGSVYRMADHVVVIGDNFRDIVTAELDVPAARTSVHQNWAHLDETTSATDRDVRNRLGWNGQTVLLHAGSMGKKQGLESVIDSARLAATQQRDLLFVLMGDGSERRALERAARDCPGVRFVDPLPEPEFRAALAAADVLLINERPGVSEMAVPSKLTSYFQAGKPVLAAVGRHGNTAEILTDAGAGLIVEPGSAHSLVEGAVALAADEETRRRCGESARRYALDHMAGTAVLAGLIARLEAVAGQPQVPADARPTSA